MDERRDVCGPLVTKGLAETDPSTPQGQESEYSLAAHPKYNGASCSLHAHVAAQACSDLLDCASNHSFNKIAGTSAATQERLCRTGVAYFSRSKLDPLTLPRFTYGRNFAGS